MMARICAIARSWIAKAALARLLRDTKAGILLNEHVAGDGPTIFEHACRFGAEGIVSKKVDGAYGLVPARSGSKSAIPPASRCSGSAARIGIDDPLVGASAPEIRWISLACVR
jgi:hypothetical protein